jgi:hypothetical protein
MNSLETVRSALLAVPCYASNRSLEMKLRGVDLLMGTPEEAEASLDTIAALVQIGNAHNTHTDLRLWAFRVLCAEMREGDVSVAMLPRVIEMMEAHDSPHWLLAHTLDMLERALGVGAFPDKRGVGASRLWASVVTLVERFARDPVVFPRSGFRVAAVKAAAGVLALLQTSSVAVPSDVLNAVFECFKGCWRVIQAWTEYVTMARIHDTSVSTLTGALPGVAAAWKEQTKLKGSSEEWRRFMLDLSSLNHALEGDAAKRWSPLRSMFCSAVVFGGPDGYTEMDAARAWKK